MSQRGQGDGQGQHVDQRVGSDNQPFQQRRRVVQQERPEGEHPGDPEQRQRHHDPVDQHPQPGGGISASDREHDHRCRHQRQTGQVPHVSDRRQRVPVVQFQPGPDQLAQPPAEGGQTEQGPSQVLPPAFPLRHVGQVKTDGVTAHRSRTESGCGSGQVGVENGQPGVRGHLRQDQEDRDRQHHAHHDPDAPAPGDQSAKGRSGGSGGALSRLEQAVGAVLVVQVRRPAHRGLQQDHSDDVGLGPAAEAGHPFPSQGRAGELRAAVLRSSGMVIVASLVRGPRAPVAA